MDGQPSYAELVWLSNAFEQEVKERGIIFPEEEQRSGALFDYIQQYIDNPDGEPTINLCDGAFELDIMFVRDTILDGLHGFVSDTFDAEKIINAIIWDVIVDVSETADPAEWHSGDVCIAMTRVLKKRLGIVE